MTTEKTENDSRKQDAADMGRITTAFYETEKLFYGAKKALAGFSSLRDALVNLHDAKTANRLPILEFRVALGVESREAMVCAVDLKKVNTEHIAHVLIPLINTLAGELLDSVDKMHTAMAEAKPLLERLANGAQ